MASFIPAILGMAGPLIGGLIGKSAAEKAAEAQQQAAIAAGQKVEGVTNTVNPAIGAAATTAGNQVIDAAGAAGNKVIDAGNVGGQNVTTAASQANDLLNPFIQSGVQTNGTLQELLKQGGDLNRNFTQQDFQQNDPGYAFRMSEAVKALERSQSARGGGMGGGASKELARYSQDYASNEFGKAFDRFSTSNNDRFNRLNLVAGRGLTAATTAGDNTIGANKFAGDMGFNAAKTAGDFNTNGAQFKATGDMHAADLMAANSIDAAKTSGDYLTQGANAKAAGIVGGANALGGGIAGAANGAAGALTLRSLLQNPALMNPSAVNPRGPNVYSGTITNPDGSLTVRRNR